MISKRVQEHLENDDHPLRPKSCFSTLPSLLIGVASEAIDYSDDCLFNGTEITIDILDKGCFSGDLVAGYGVALKIYKEGDTDNVYSTYDGISCHIDDTITVNPLTLDIVAPTFADQNVTYNGTAVTLQTVVDGSLTKEAEFGSEVAVYASLSISSHFTAALTGCQVNNNNP